MTAPRLHEVVARVVAWHNRHPLARRIDASQVHSIGEVQLPFVSRQAGPGTPAGGAAPAPPTQEQPPASGLAAALAQRSARLHPPGGPVDDAAAARDADDAAVLVAMAAIASGQESTGGGRPRDDTKAADVPSGTGNHRAAAEAGSVATDQTDLAASADAVDERALDGAPHRNETDDEDGEAALVIPLLDGDAAGDPGREAPAADMASEPPADTFPDLADDPSADAAAPTPDPGAPDAAAADIPLDTDAADAPTDALSAALADAAADGVADADANRAAAAAAASAAALSAAEPASEAVSPEPSHGAIPTLTDEDVHPPLHGGVPASALARAVERRAAARAPGQAAETGPAAAADASDAHATHDDALAPAGGTVHGTTAAAVAGEALAAAPVGRWRRLLQALRRLLTGRQPGLPPLRPAFSEDFAWPLAPARIARWAQRHGSALPLAPADWPRRRIDADRARLATLRQKGQAHDLPLHVLTAAIGVGDRRIRVLVGADGSVLGPRAWDRGRAGAAASVLAVGLVALGWTLRPLHGAPQDVDAAVLAALVASAASAPEAPVAASAVAAASAAASAVADDAGAHAHPPQHAEAAASDAMAPAAASAGASAPEAATVADAAASAPPADIRPVLSAEEKYAARVEAARLRGEPPPPPPEPAGPVYALVGPSSTQRDTAAGSLALMKAAAAKLDGSAPVHGELVQNQGQWRAAWWPFTSLVDAERARVLLAGRGLKAEVVEF